MVRTFVRQSGRVAGAALFLMMIPLLHADTVPAGEVSSPRLGEYLVPVDQTIRFSGWVDFPQGAGTITIYVRSKLNLGFASVDFWLPAAFVAPNATGITVGSQTRYNWSYSAPRSQLFSGNSWPEGGTGRARVFASRVSGSGVYLRVVDGSLVPATNEEIVLADRDPTPADLPAANTPDYLNMRPTLSQNETRAYYQSVRTDPRGAGATVASALPTLEAFKRRYFDSAAACPNTFQRPESTATYFNQGDLGLGREMHCVRNECTKELACYVMNYGSPDGTPIFNRIDQAAAAVQAHRPFATVAMVERGDMAVGAANKVFFAVYDHQQLLQSTHPDSAPLSLQARLDNKGFNKSIPANCLVCHGIASRYTAASVNTANAKVNGAYFLPFDLNAFDFFATSPSNPLSRSTQEASFKRLNELVYFSDLWFNSDANELLDGWYGGAAWLSPTFKGSFVPRGWTNASNATDDGNRRQLYTNVVARSCRTCHITDARVDDPYQAGSRTFGSYNQLYDSRVSAYSFVCRNHVMPNAEQSLKQFWASPARAHFLNRLSLPDDCNLQPRSGSATAARLSSGADEAASSVSAIGTSTLTEVYALDACNCTTLDCLKAVDDQYLHDLSTAPSEGAAAPTVLQHLGKASECRQRLLDWTGRVALEPSNQADRFADRDRERLERAAR